MPSALTVQYSTYKEACLARGLLEDDQEWRLCLQDAGDMQSGSQLRRLFATILAFCFPSNPRNLWNLFKHHICDDLECRLHITYRIRSPSDDQVHDYGLFLIDKILNNAGKSLDQFRDMPQVTGSWDDLVGNRFVAEQMNYGTSAESANAMLLRTLPDSIQARKWSMMRFSIQCCRQTVVENLMEGLSLSMVQEALARLLLGTL